MRSAFIYVNSIITRGHFPTFYHKITFSANKQEENTVAEELGIFCHSQLLVKESERLFLVLACLFVFLGSFALRTDRHHDDQRVCLWPFRTNATKHTHSLPLFWHAHIHTPQRISDSSKMFFKNNLWSKKIFCVSLDDKSNVFFDKKQNSVIYSCKR